MAFLAFLNNNIEQLAFGMSILAAISGVVAWLLVTFFWKRISSYYREQWAKYAVIAFRFFAAISAVLSKLATVPEGQSWYEQRWIQSLILAAFGYFFWEFAGVKGDSKYKRAKDKNEAEHQSELDALARDREDAQNQALRVNRLLTHLRETLSEKLQRVRRIAAANKNAKASVAQLRAGLSPDEQIQIIFESLALLLRTDAVSDGGAYETNFRVGLYVEVAGQLRPLGAFDLATKSHKPFASPETSSDRFRLDNNSNPSLAVRCVLEGRTLYVADCSTELSFNYFDDKQRHYLRSIVAFPLAHFCPDGME